MAVTPYPFVSGTVLTASALNSTFNIPTTTKTASHTLIAADAGTRVIMNSASATTITVNTSIFAASDIVEIQNIGAGVCTITAGTATVSTTGSLSLSQNGSGRLVFTAAGTSIFQANGVAVSGVGLKVVQAETALSGSSTTADGVFTSTYTNYRIVARYTTSAANLDIQFRAAGVNTTTNYNFQFLESNSTTVAGARTGPTSSFLFGDSSSGSFFSLAIVDLSGVQLAEPTVFNGVCTRNPGSYTASRTGNIAGNQSASTAFDGINFLVASGTMSGTYTIYGYSKTV